jgi:AcrR family transcriptional regulator
MSVPPARTDAPPGAARAAPAPRDPAATRRRLIEAGTALFAARGLHAVTSAQIAHRAGLATGTFYLHFKDKTHLFHEIAFAALAELRARQERAAAGLAPGSAAQARRRTEELVAFAEERRDLIRVAFGRGGESARVGEELMEEIVAGVAQRLRERLAARQVPPDLHPELAAQAIAGMTVRVLTWWIDHPESASREEVVATLLDMVPGPVPAAATPTSHE